MTECVTGDAGVSRRPRPHHFRAAGGDGKCGRSRDGAGPRAHAQGYPATRGVADEPPRGAAARVVWIVLAHAPKSAIVLFGNISGFRVSRGHEQHLHSSATLKAREKWA